jgi:23S rRNA pseudouridine955/2504/2580 synthase
MKEVKTLEVAAAEDGIRLDRWFRRRWPHVSQIAINKLARSGQIRVDGARAKVDTRLGAGAQVRVPPLPDAPDKSDGPPPLSPQDVAYVKAMVIYEDDDVIALNKPAGLAVQGGTKTTKHIDRLLSAWGEGMHRPRLVHRLDRDTSGVLLLGKGPEAAKRLAGAFARRQAKKTYWAIVAGNPKPGEGVIELHLLKSGLNDREMVRPADPKEPGAETAETEFVTLSRAAHRAAWMALRPHTGRTHQLRAHMKAIGHPILGDPKYGDETTHELSGNLKLQLHARRVELDHPGGGKLIVEAPISAELRAGFERFGFDEHEADPEPFRGRAPSNRTQPNRATAERTGGGGRRPPTRR